LLFFIIFLNERRVILEHSCVWRACTLLKPKKRKNCRSQLHGVGRHNILKGSTGKTILALTFQNAYRQQYQGLWSRQIRKLRCSEVHHYSQWQGRRLKLYRGNERRQKKRLKKDKRYSTKVHSPGKRKGEASVPWAPAYLPGQWSVITLRMQKYTETTIIPIL
jgi:hypothetical protein